MDCVQRVAGQFIFARPSLAIPAFELARDIRLVGEPDWLHIPRREDRQS